MLSTFSPVQAKFNKALLENKWNKWGQTEINGVRLDIHGVSC
jgi:hypothetical protein